MEIQEVFKLAEKGGFTVYVPLLPGCISEGIHLGRLLRILKRLWSFILKQTMKMLIDSTDKC